MNLQDWERSIPIIGQKPIIDSQKMSRTMAAKPVVIQVQGIAEQMVYIKGDEVAIYLQAPDWLKDRIPKLVSNRFPNKTKGDSGTYLFHDTAVGSSIMVSAQYHLKTATRWIHISAANKKRMPTHDELCEYHKYFVGLDLTGISFYPKTEHHVNIYFNCLHIFFPLDRTDELPDFRINREGEPGI